MTGLNGASVSHHPTILLHKSKLSTVLIQSLLLCRRPLLPTHFIRLEWRVEWCWHNGGIYIWFPEIHLAAIVNRNYTGRPNTWDHTSSFRHLSNTLSNSALFLTTLALSSYHHGQEPLGLFFFHKSSRKYWKVSAESASLAVGDIAGQSVTLAVESLHISGNIGVCRL